MIPEFIALFQNIWAKAVISEFNRLWKSKELLWMTFNVWIQDLMESYTEQFWSLVEISLETFTVSSMGCHEVID